jgi:hypothetical protein
MRAARTRGRARVGFGERIRMMGGARPSAYAEEGGALVGRAGPEGQSGLRRRGRFAGLPALVG